jgi:hypothetical protein
VMWLVSVGALVLLGGVRDRRGQAVAQKHLVRMKIFPANHHSADLVSKGACA